MNELGTIFFSVCQCVGVGESYIFQNITIKIGSMHHFERASLRGVLRHPCHQKDTGTNAWNEIYGEDIKCSLNKFLESG